MKYRMQNQFQNGPQNGRLYHTTNHQNRCVVKHNHWHGDKTISIEAGDGSSTQKIVGFKEQVPEGTDQRNETDGNNCRRCSRHAKHNRDAVALVYRRHSEQSFAVEHRQYIREEKPAG
jgi:hypothetical protein